MMTRLDPDELAALEEERDFLLRSIDDLELEAAEGNLEDADYRRLRDDYTARAAEAIRSIEADSARVTAPPVPLARRLLIGAGVMAFAVVAAVLLARSLGERLPGESVTGNEQLRDRVAQADALLEEGQAAEALRVYDEAAREAPGSAEPRVKSALIVFEAGLVDEALSRLDEAEAADPRYAETWFVRGIVLVRGRGDTEAARAAFARYLDLAPDGPYAEDTRVILQELEDPNIEDKEKGS